MIELSLASPMFQELGPDARGLLGVAAFFPQGVDENNIDWLFPTVSNGMDIFDGFCVLSLTSRSNGFITMLAPLRDYLSPNDPRLSPLLCAAKELYFIRMSVDLDPNESNFKEAQWITSEDTNVEHLLDVFTTIDADSDDIWEACANFMEHLNWHKPRLTLLAPKIEGLPDSHRRKSEYLIKLSALFGLTKNHTGQERLLSYALKLERERGSGIRVARILSRLAGANRQTGLHDEGVQQAREALEIYERLVNTKGQAQCWLELAWSFRGQKQFDAAEEAAFRVINLLSETGEEFLVCDSHRVLGAIYESKGEIEKAIYHYEAALGIASTFDWHSQLPGIHLSLLMLFSKEGRLDRAHFHAERAKLCAVNDPYKLGQAMMLYANVLCQQRKFEEARSEALRAAEIFEKLGSSWGMRVSGRLLGAIQKKRDRLVASRKLREFLHTMALPGVLVSNLWPRNRTKAFMTESNPRDATSRYPVLSHCPSQHPSIQLQTIYVPPFVRLLYSLTSPFASSRCSSLALNVER